MYNIFREEYYLDGKKVTKEEFDNYLQSKKITEEKKGGNKKNKDNSKDHKTNVGLNIYEARSFLKSMPHDTQMMMYKSNGSLLTRVKLDELGNLMAYNSETKDCCSVFDVFSDETVLFAKFYLIKEPKETWIDCNIEIAIRKYDYFGKIKVIIDGKEYVYDGEKDNIDKYEHLMNNLHNLMMKGAKWQYAEMK